MLTGFAQGDSGPAWLPSALVMEITCQQAVSVLQLLPESWMQMQPLSDAVLSYRLQYSLHAI